jgi:hypothetical protein
MNTTYDLVCPITGEVVATEDDLGNALELREAYSEIKGMHLQVVLNTTRPQHTAQSEEPVTQS